MARFLSFLLIFGVTVTAGCDRQQPVNPSVAKGNTAVPTAPAKPPSMAPATTTGQPGVKAQPTFQQPSSPVQHVAQEPKAELGVSEGRPVLFFELRTGMVIRISKIQYDNTGSPLNSYEASVQSEKGEEAKVLVRTETPAGVASTYAATVNGKPVTRQSDKKLVGFSVKDSAGGVVMARPRANSRTEFSYDPTGRVELQTTIVEGLGTNLTKLSYTPSGRQQVAQQDFQHEGKTYTINYSDYRWDSTGRLEGYSAQVVRAE